MLDGDDLLVQLDLKNGTVRLHADEHLLPIGKGKSKILEKETAFALGPIRCIHRRHPFLHFSDDGLEIAFR